MEVWSTAAYLTPKVAQLLRESPSLEACVVAPHWPGTPWFAELMELSDQWATFPAGSLRRVAFDAPARLESWPVTAFRVPQRA